MMPTSSSRPSGAPQVLPYLYYPDATAALDFLIAAFDFKEISAFRDESGTVLHAQMSTGEGLILLGPGMDEFGTRPVQDANWATSRTFVYVDDVDEHFRRAMESGAVIVSEPTDLGPNRVYVARDCGGQQWIFAKPLDR